jgi:hypothetical protein
LGADNPLMDPSATPTRITVAGSFTLPCDVSTALLLFTPEGERAWVEGWSPTYLSGATDEVGAVWSTDAHSPTTWVTVVRTDRHVAYARISDNGTAGLVDVRCLPADGGTAVHVTYDMTATRTTGLPWLQHLRTGFDGMLQGWRKLTLPLVT